MDRYRCDHTSNISKFSNRQTLVKVQNIVSELLTFMEGDSQMARP